MNLIKCYQTTSTWYTDAPQGGRPVGILWHDTGAGNPNLARYVQPSNDAPDRQEMLALIGKNAYSNDWNHIALQAGVNAWIGKLADGTVGTVLAGDFDIHAWGCGSGKFGSCNGYTYENGKQVWDEPYWVQFEICDDFYKDKNYFEQVYREAVEFTAYVCKEFGIDPMGEVDFAGKKVPTIICHADSHALGLGSNHGDVYTWFAAMGREKSMEQVRKDVAACLAADGNSTDKVELHKQDVVRLKPGAVYTTGAAVPDWVINSMLYYRGRSGDDYVISTLAEGDVTGVVAAEWVELVSCPHEDAETPETPETPEVVDPVLPEAPAAGEVDGDTSGGETGPDDGDDDDEDDDFEIIGQPEDGRTPIEIEGDADGLLESDHQLIAKILKLIGEWLRKIFSFLRKS